MKLNLFATVLLTVLTGYVLKLSFYGMNLPSDTTYIGGIGLLAIWFFFVLPLTFKRIWRKREKASSTATRPAV